MAASGGKAQARRTVPAALHEATPNAWGQWLLASPALGFLAWLWVDLAAPISALGPWWLGATLALLIFAALAVLPLGVAAHALVTAAPRLFQNAGWDVAPLESVRDSEQYVVKYIAVSKVRAPRSWSRLWLRAAQGWVYLEILLIFLGAGLLIPLFLSVSDFGFGR